MQTNIKNMLSRGCQKCLASSKIFHLSRRLISVKSGQLTHYDILGVSAGATQSEIKAAYYKLSKVYHPDINKDSQEASIKFRMITEAYETVGNVQKRRMYDKGVMFDSSPDMQETEEQAGVSKFYKSRGTTYSGKTPIYDFDEWSKSHYGKTFARREKAKARYANEGMDTSDLRGQNQSLGTVSVFALVAIVLLSYFGNPNADVDRLAEKRKQAK